MIAAVDAGRVVDAPRYRYPSREWRMIGLRLPGRRFTRTAGFFPDFAFDFLLDELGFFTAAPPLGIRVPLQDPPPGVTGPTGCG